MGKMSKQEEKGTRGTSRAWQVYTMLTEAEHRALKEAAARRGASVSGLLGELLLRASAAEVE